MTNKLVHHISHNKCLKITYDQCYSCREIEQRTLTENQTPVENNIQIEEVTDHQTDIIHVDTTTIMASKNNFCSGLQQTNTDHEYTTNSHIRERKYATPILTDKQEQQTTKKELKQQEFKLKKKRGTTTFKI